jgi:hypothetical protein
MTVKKTKKVSERQKMTHRVHLQHHLSECLVYSHITRFFPSARPLLAATAQPPDDRGSSVPLALHSEAILILCQKKLRMRVIQCAGELRSNIEATMKADSCRILDCYRIHARLPFQKQTRDVRISRLSSNVQGGPGSAEEWEKSVKRPTRYHHISSSRRCGSIVRTYRC